MNLENSNTEIEPENPPITKKGIKRFIVPSLGTGSWMTRTRRLAVRVFLWYVVIVIVIAFLQRKLIYHPTRSSTRLFAVESRLMRGTVHGIEIETHDGLILNGWHFLPRCEKSASRDENDRILKESSWLVLYFPGNAGNRQMRQYDAEVFTRNGANVFLFDYRGYGENPGSPSEANLLKDARAVWNFATNERNVPANKIILFGESLGGGVAVQLCADLCEEGTPPAGLFLVGTFSSLVDVAAFHFPVVPVRWIMWDRYQSIDRTISITCPVAQIHGRRDEIVPFEFGQRLFDSFPKQSATGIEKQMLELTDVGHDNIPAGPMQNFVRKFIRKLGLN